MNNQALPVGMKNAASTFKTAWPHLMKLKPCLPETQKCPFLANFLETFLAIVPQEK